MKYFIFVPNKDSRKLTDYAKDLYYTFIEKYNYSENEIKWYLAKNGIEFQGVENILFDFQDYILDHMYEYGNYSYEDGDYELIEESKKSTRKSITESKSSIRFEDFVESNAYIDLTYLVYVGYEKDYHVVNERDIYEYHKEWLQLNVYKWSIGSKYDVTVYLQ